MSRLYDNFKDFDIPEKGPQSRETLRQDFPSFYEDKAITLSAHPSRFKMATKVLTKNTSKETKPQRKAPEPIGLTLIGNFMIDGKPKQLSLSASAPEAGAFGNRFPPASLKTTVGNKLVIQPHEEAELFFFHFGVPYVSNNKHHKKGGLNLFQWDQPEVTANKRISDAKYRAQLEKRVYEDFSDATVTRLINALSIPAGDGMAQSRTNLFDAYMTRSEEFKAMFDDIASSATSGDNASLLDVSEFTQSLIDAEKIKLTETGYVSKSKQNIGEWNKTPFFRTTLTGDEAYLALVEHLKVNSELRKKIE
jgi:hypothetical protein